MGKYYFTRFLLKTRVLVKRIYGQLAPNRLYFGDF